MSHHGYSVAQIRSGRNRLRIRSLAAKLRIVIVLLMLLIVSITALAFLASARITETQILRAQILADSAKVAEALNARMEVLRFAAGALAEDPVVSRSVNRSSEEALQSLNARAVAVRDRFGVGLIQIYDAHGRARSNLLLSSLYRESSILGQVGRDRTVVREIEGRIVLLSRADATAGWGAIITGVDLEHELKDIAGRYRLASDIGIQLAATTGGDYPTHHRISTRDDGSFPFDGAESRGQKVYTERMALELGDDTIDIMLALPADDIRLLTVTGLTVTFLSLLTTTGILVLGSMMLMRAFVRPVQVLSETARDVARGDLRRRAPQTSASFLKIGRDDEFEALTQAFNQMVAQLQDLYDSLEVRVADRTRELETAALVARTVASSLDLDVVLHETSDLIQRRFEADTVAAYIIDASHNVARLEYASGTLYPLRKGDTVPLDTDTTIGLAAGQHTLCLIQDTRTTSRYLPTTWFSRARSVITAPILQGRDVIGVLDLQSRQPGQFTAEKAHLLNMLSDQIAIGIQNAQRYADEQRRRRFTEVLELTGRILSGSRDMKELPGRILASLQALASYERGSLWVTEGKQLKPLAQYGYIDERPLRKQQATIEMAYFKQLAAERRPVIVGDLQESPAEPAARIPDREQLWLRGDRAWMGVPIITAQGKIIGVVCLASNEIDAFSDEDAMWVQAFASQAAIALENAQLYAQVSAEGPIGEASTAPHSAATDPDAANRSIVSATL
jgi:GAF domain-containing protein/HAMP domain-containing protein